MVERKGAIDPIILIGAIHTPGIGVAAGIALRVGRHEVDLADALPVHQNPPQIVGAVGAVVKAPKVALVAEAVGAGLAGTGGGVGHGEGPAVGLTQLGGDVEEDVRGIALPGHHVEDGGLAPVEPAVALNHDGLQYLDPEGGGAVDGLVDELPLVLETAPSVGVLEGSDSHYEIVHKLYRNLEKATVGVSVPLLVDDVVCPRGLNVVGVEDDLGEVDVADLDPGPEGDVPEVVGLVDDLGVDVELQGPSELAINPEAGHEDDDVVPLEGGREGVELPSAGLLGVVYLVDVVGEVIHLGGDVDLR